MPFMSFPEIIQRYGRHPPLLVAASLRMGRPATRAHHLTSQFLLAAEAAAVEAGAPLRDVRDEMRTVLGAWPENLSRPLTVDEAFSLCDRLGIDPSSTLMRAAEHAKGQLSEDE